MAELTPSDAAVSAWIEDNPREFAAWIDAQRSIGGPAPAPPDVADEMLGGIIRDILEALCRRDGVPTHSYIEPGKPARNYALAERLGIGHVFGLPASDAAAPAPPFGGEVHVDWHMTTGEWRQLYTDLWQHTDTPYIARLIGAGKIPAPPAGMQAAPAPAGDLRDRIEAALDASMDRCARCKTCDVQVDAVMAAIAAAAPAPQPFTRDQLETALAGAIQEIIDEEEAAAAPAPAGEGEALEVAVQALRDIALGTELALIGRGPRFDASVRADKALVAIRDMQGEPQPQPAPAGSTHEERRLRDALLRLLAAAEREPDDSEFAGLVEDIARDALGSDEQPPAAPDLARAEAAGIRAAGANTARDLAQARASLLEIARAAQGSIDGNVAPDLNWFVGQALDGLGEEGPNHDGLTECARCDAQRELAELRELLGEIGVMAANAPEDDAFAVCEEIAMRIAAMDVPDTTPVDEWPDPENPVTGRTPGAAW